MVTTRWSLVLAAADPASPEARQALAALCEIYWNPVHQFVRCCGHSPEDAKDLTQAFFARVVEKGDFRGARRERGRFRAFLLTAVRHFLSNQFERDQALKRGGGFVHVSIDAKSDSDRIFDREPTSHETPETIFEERWALATLDAAMARLARERANHGHDEMFTRLQPLLAGDASASCAAVARELGVPEPSIRVAVHRLRKQFGECLRATLAETVADPVDVPAELDYLRSVINRRRPAEALERS